MKNVNKLNLILLTFTSVILLTACGGGSNYTELSDGSFSDNDTSIALDPTNSETTTSSDSDLSSVEIEGLLLMREEEEFARDLYLDIYEAKGDRLNTFKNISDNAETKHAEAIRVLLEKYSIEDPSTGNRNTYSDQELQILYDDLMNIAVGSDDVEALRVGALVEETDIRDINTQKSYVSVDHQDIIATYDNLLCGSRNHLRAFVKQIENRTGSSYVTQIPELDSEVREILSSPKERCGE